jgi:V8-like Glu-specific endopeptidase
MKTSKDYFDIISAQLKIFNKKAVHEISNDLVNDLYSSEGNFEEKYAEKIMQQLRSKRLFVLMQKIGDALIQTGRLTYKIRRQYAQAFIDQNNITAAISILKELESDTSNAANNDSAAKEENIEARGLLGRSYKQLYIIANNPQISHNANFLKQAIKFYLDVYTSDPETRTWHGINAVACLARAKRDNLPFDGFPSSDELANSVLNTIQNKYENKKADAWDFATAAEACVALNKLDDALEWISGYSRMLDCDAFELASTLRQLEEVWQLNMSSDSGRILLPVLRAELLKRDGGNILIHPSELSQQKINENRISADYKSSMKKQNSKDSKAMLEKVFGEDSFKTYKWYMLGADRCLAVARIGRDSSKGFGTGFLLQGIALHESLKDELILITNSHVVSNSVYEKALRPEEAIVIFEALDRDQEFKISEIIWSSPSDDLDASVLRFEKSDYEKLKDLTKNVKIYPTAKYLPILDADNSQRIYVIGHPFGGTLQLSFQDNVLLDYQDPKIHYRTPTEGGSSGSPVFNQQWDLIGIHHAGSEEMPCLNGKSGTYEANEGIWIQAIRNKIFK